MQNPSCKLAVFISGGGSNLQSIIDHVEQGHIPASIACVISNKPDAYGLERAKKASIPTHIIEHQHYPSREAFEQELIKTLAVYNIKLIVLAGFMRVLGETLINEYPGKILNIHPSLLPKFTGMHTHSRVLEAKEHEHGCSVHFVTLALDAGPLVIQAKVPVEDTDTAEVLAARVLEKEHVIYPLAVKWFCEGKLSMQDDDAYFENAVLEKPIYLSAALEEQLQ